MKKLFGVMLAVLAAFGLGSCKKDNNYYETKVQPVIVPEENRKIKDIAGREVELPEKISRVCAIGAGALRLYSYVADVDYICAVERIENETQQNNKNAPLRLYYEKNKEYFTKLPFCGLGGKMETTPNEEELLRAKPDVIFSAHPVEAIEKLQARINIPVVRIFYHINDIKDPDLIESLKIIGKVMNKSARAEELINYINGELASIVAATKDKETTPIYYACNSKSGQRGIQSTVAGYSIFDVANVKNIIDALEPEGAKLPKYYTDFSLEILKRLNPKRIIVDGGGIGMLKNDFANPNTRAILESIDAFKNNEVYVQLPCNAYQSNVEMELIDSYYAASVAYPEVYNREFVVSKTREITQKFLGEDFYDLIMERVPEALNKLDLSIVM